MYYDLDDNIDNQNIPDEFIEITSLLKVHKKNVRKKMLKLLHQNFNEDCEDSKKQLMDIMEYAIFSGGKHYRSFFVELLGKMFDINLAKSLFVGSIIEMMHNYIIMQTAMPELENDDYRHNRESCHKKFGSAQTIVASNTLYSLIMEIITSNGSVKLNNDIRCQIVKIIAKYSGKDGIGGGQMMKLLFKKKQLENDEKTRIRKLKINSLFLAGAECIEIIANVNEKQKQSLKTYISNLCNLMNTYEEIYKTEDEGTINELLNKSKMFCEQGKKSISKIENSNLLVSFLQYNNYCIEKLANEKKQSRPLAVQSDIKECQENNIL